MTESSWLASSLQTLLSLPGVGNYTIAEDGDLLEACLSWCHEVEWLAKTVEPEASPTEFSGSESLDDYDTMLSNRTWLERAVLSMPDPASSALARWLAAGPDREFLRVTEEDPDGLWLRGKPLESNEPTVGWWWHRLPRSGVIPNTLRANASRT